MNLQDMIGPVDAYSGFVAVVAFAGFTIISTTAIARRQSRLQLTQNFELEKWKISSNEKLLMRKADQEHEQKLAKFIADKEVQIRRIESGMIDVKAVHPGADG